MKKVLIVEDNQFLAKVLDVKMKKAGFETKIARNGQEVFPMLGAFKADIIILDLILPKKDGFEVLKELKASDAYKNIPVLVTTNLSQPEDKERTKRLGAVDYIVKSDISIRDIVDKVNTYATH